MRRALIIPAPTADQIQDHRIAAVAILEIVGGVIGALAVTLALCRVATATLTAVGVIVVGAALIPHAVAIVMRWKAVNTGGDQGLVRVGALIQGAIGVATVVVGLMLLGGLSRGLLVLAAVALSTALLIGGPAHALMGPLRPVPRLFGDTSTLALGILAIAVCAFLAALNALTAARSSASTLVALFLASVTLVAAGVARGAPEGRWAGRVA